MPPALARPTLIIIAGPNGAGKSTLYENRIAPKLAAPFINADIIQKNELKDIRLEAAYEAASIATERRRECLAEGKSFVTESVFSHPSKLDLINEAKTSGFLVMVFHVGIDSPDLSIARVKTRVAEGGHDVPDQKIRERYDRNGPLIRQAVLSADLGHVFDNSKLNVPPKRVLSFSTGQLTHVDPYLPNWAARTYAADLKRQ
ncbi:MAG: zeta toxin family protein [Pseudomonadota bacterium]